MDQKKTSFEPSRYFGKFEIYQEQVFYDKNGILGLVNISPLIENHVLVIPISLNSYSNESTTNINLLSMLDSNVAVDLYKAVLEIKDVFNANIPDINAFNIATQDGRAAGQSVPHVHFHIIPRKTINDFGNPEGIHEKLQNFKYQEEGEKEYSVEERRKKRDLNNPKDLQSIKSEKELYESWFSEDLKADKGGTTHKPKRKRSKKKRKIKKKKTIRKK